MGRFSNPKTGDKPRFISVYSNRGKFISVYRYRGKLINVHFFSFNQIYHTASDMQFIPTEKSFLTEIDPDGLEHPRRNILIVSFYYVILLLYFTNTPQFKIPIVPEEGWFGQTKCGTPSKKNILRCVGFCLCILRNIPIPKKKIAPKRDLVVLAVNFKGTWRTMTRSQSLF